VFRDGKPIKQRLAVPADVEEALHHAHGERFSKPAGTSEQSHFACIIMNKIVDQLCLVHIVTAAASKFMKIFCPYENSNRHDLAPPFTAYFLPQHFLYLIL
jgi:hypothetical protein